MDETKVVLTPEVEEKLREQVKNSWSEYYAIEGRGGPAWEAWVFSKLCTAALVAVENMPTSNKGWCVEAGKAYDTIGRLQAELAALQVPVHGMKQHAELLWTDAKSAFTGKEAFIERCIKRLYEIVATNQPTCEKTTVDEAGVVYRYSNTGSMASEGRLKDMAVEIDKITAKRVAAVVAERNNTWRHEMECKEQRHAAELEGVRFRCRQALNKLREKQETHNTPSAFTELPYPYTLIVSI